MQEIKLNNNSILAKQTTTSKATARPQATPNSAQTPATKLEPQLKRELNQVDLVVPGDQFLMIGEMEVN